MRIIALEEHYASHPISDDNAVANMFANENRSAYDRLYDVGNLRLEQMEQAGIDYQILSLLDPGVQELADPGQAEDAARKYNEELAAVVQRQPTKFGAFAALATQNPNAAAEELRRAVKELKFHGALINGHTNGRYLDAPEYDCIFAAAQELDVPIYLHPTTPHPKVMEAWFEPYAKDGLHLASWGFAAETGTHALRLIYSGLFDRYPRLKMILGHMGEMLPFAMYRLDRYYLPGAWYLTPEQKREKMRLEHMPSEYLKRNFWITTSGNFSVPALQCSIATMGAERILFSVDYPMDDNQTGTDFLRHAPITPVHRIAIAQGNAEKLFRLPAK